MSSVDVIDQIMMVMEASFDPRWGEAWNRRQITDSLAMPNVSLVLMDPSGQIVKQMGPPAAGFVLTRQAADEEELLLIAVMPEHRGRGLGSRLISHLVNSAKSRGTKKIFLEMRSNNPAEKLYRDRGFIPIGHREKYYQTSDGNRLDAITFGLTI